MSALLICGVESKCLSFRVFRVITVISGLSICIVTAVGWTTNTGLAPPNQPGSTSSIPPLAFKRPDYPVAVEYFFGQVERTVVVMVGGFVADR